MRRIAMHAFRQALSTGEDEDQFREVVTQPATKKGDVIFFSEATVHGSRPARLTGERAQAARARAGRQPERTPRARARVRSNALARGKPVKHTGGARALTGALPWAPSDPELQR